MNQEINIDFIYGQIDKDNSGSITIDELRVFLGENEVSYLDMDVKEIMSELDKNNDGVITAEEFKDCFNKLLDKLG